MRQSFIAFWSLREKCRAAEAEEEEDAAGRQFVYLGKMSLSGTVKLEDIISEGVSVCWSIISTWIAQ